MKKRRPRPNGKLIITNLQVVEAFTLGLPGLATLKLPVDLSFQLVGTIDEINRAYDAFVKTQNQIISDHSNGKDGVDQAKDPEAWAKVNAAVQELLAIEISLNVQSVPLSRLLGSEQRCPNCRAYLTAQRNMIEANALRALKWLVDPSK